MPGREGYEELRRMLDERRKEIMADVERNIAAAHSKEEADPNK